MLAGHPLVEPAELGKELLAPRQHILKGGRPRRPGCHASTTARPRSAGGSGLSQAPRLVADGLNVAGAAPGLGARGRPDERSRLATTADLPLGGAPPDHLQAPYRAREERVDLSMRPIAGESSALHPESLPYVHVDDGPLSAKPPFQARAGLA